MNEVMERTQIQMFAKEEFGKIRTIVLNEEPWFVAKDVCDILEVNNSRQAMTRLEDFEKNSVILNDGNKGNPNITVISESGFYALVLSSRKPIAKPFRIWVTSEVLPSIRKTGKYVAKTDGELFQKLGELEQKFGLTVMQLNNVEETLDIQNKKLDAVMDNMTLTTVQQGRLQRAVKDRVNILLGGAHSQEYRRDSRMYFINIWNGIKQTFNCGSRWQDLNPTCYKEALNFISKWEYIEE